MVLRCPLALAERIQDRLAGKPGPVLLVTTDLDDPLPSWFQTRQGRGYVEAPLRWRSMVGLASLDDRIHKVIDHERKTIRRFLPTRLALASPRLAPGLALLTGAVPRLRRNKDNWTLRHGGELLATLYGFNAGTHEGLQLRLTDCGLDHWPALEPDQRAPGKYPVTWTLRPEEVPEFVEAIQPG